MPPKWYNKGPTIRIEQEEEADMTEEADMIEQTCRTGVPPPSPQIFFFCGLKRGGARRTTRLPSSVGGKSTLKDNKSVASEECIQQF